MITPISYLRIGGVSRFAKDHDWVLTIHDRLGGLPPSTDYDGVLVTPACHDPYYRRCARVSMGAVFQVPWARIETADATVGLGRLSGSCDWATALVPRLREAGFITAAMALREDSIGLRDQRLGAADRLAIVLGTEGDGLLDSTIEACDYTVLVPMAHQVDSLNVSVAAGIAFWELGSSSQI